MLAFAVTIHKAQGLSLQSAIIDAGKSYFRSGMIHVALSRVTSLAGKHLLISTSLESNVTKMLSLNAVRLRQKYTPHLGKMASTELCKKKQETHQEMR